ncbi:hypothetical protein GCM10027570_21770 [Streptomonospora sediminis]
MSVESTEPTESAEPVGAPSTGRGPRLLGLLRLRRLLGTGSANAPPRLRPTPLGLFAIMIGAMFITLLLIQSTIGTFRTDAPDTPGSGADPAVAAEPPAGTARIMIAGDSIAQGSSGDYTWRYRLWRHLNKRSGLDVEFVGPNDTLLNLADRDRGDTSYAAPGFDTDHASQWGATAREIAAGIGEQTAAHDPDYLLFMAGVNDFVHGDSADDALSAVRDAVTTARVAHGGIQVVLGQLTPVWGRDADDDLNARIAEFNAALPALAREMSGDNSPVTVARTAADYAPAKDTWDGTHPNARGELKIAAAFADALADPLHFGDPYRRPLPDVPVGPQQAPEVTAAETREGVRLTWDPVPGATRYQVLQQRLEPDPDEQVRLPMEVAGSGQPSAVVDQLLAGATYEFQVQPYKGGDGGARSEPVEIVPADDPPPAPDRVRADPGATELTWDKVSSATHYEVWRRPLHCAGPEESPTARPDDGSGSGSAAPTADPPDSGGAAGSGTAGPDCGPADPQGPDRGDGWHSVAIVNDRTRWSIPADGAAGWEFAVRSHRDFVRGGYSDSVTVRAPE